MWFLMNSFLFIRSGSRDRTKEENAVFPVTLWERICFDLYQLKRENDVIVFRNGCTVTANSWRRPADVLFRGKT